MAPKPDSETQKNLITSSRQGDLEAFEKIIEAWQEPLYQFIFSEMGSNEALEMTSSIFVKAFHKLELLKDRDDFQTWLYRLAAKECARQKKLMAQNPKEQKPSNQKTSLTSALSQLESSFSQPLILHHIQNKPYEEIGQILGVPTGTIKTRIHRGHKVLADKIKS